MRLLHARVYNDRGGDTRIRLKVLGDVRLNQNTKQLTRDELKKLLSGHLCRCTGYENIINAVEKTMNKRLGEREGE